MTSQLTRSLWKYKPSLFVKSCMIVSGSGLCTIAYMKQVEWRTEWKYNQAMKNKLLESSTKSNHKYNNNNENDNNNGETVAYLPRVYDKQMMDQYWDGRPYTVIFRISQIMMELIPIISSYIYDFHIQTNNKTNTDTNTNTSQEHLSLQRYHAKRLKNVLTRLGPAFVKGGQQLSIRPDLVPPVVLHELQQLCDSVTPVPNDIAMQVLADELGLKHVQQLQHLFHNLELVAAASLGQVYKTTLKDTKEQVAIKVQRPDMLRKVSLDLYLLHKIAYAMDAFTSTFTQQAPYHRDLVDTFASGSYLELDYENEAMNQMKFRHEFQLRKSNIVIPNVYTQFTSRKVIVTEWINGIKLADAPKPMIQKLIPEGVELFLTQLLDIGSFHADPHPGNLYVTNKGELCLLDFGLIAEIDETSMHAMTAAIVHLLIGDFDSLVSEDAKKLGFLPHSMDTSEIQPILKTILTQGLLESGSNLHDRKRKLMQISNELNDIFFRYPFSVPPFFALITRGLGLLEGIALSGDPNFDIFQASYPYARRRAVEIFGQHGINQMKRRMTMKQQQLSISK